MQYAKALIPFALFMAGLLVGWGWTSARWSADVAAIHLDIAEHKLNAALTSQTIERLQVVADNALAEAAAASAKAHGSRVEYVTKEVVKYVQSTDAGRCAAAPSWVRAYNAGWDGGLPGAKDSSSLGDGAASGVRADGGGLDGRGAAADRHAEQPQPPHDQ